MMSLVRLNNNDISFADNVHCSVSIHKKKFSLKDSYYALEIELRPRQLSLGFDSKQSDGKTATALGRSS